MYNIIVLNKIDRKPIPLYLDPKFLDFLDFPNLVFVNSNVEFHSV